MPKSEERLDEAEAVKASGARLLIAPASVGGIRAAVAWVGVTRTANRLKGSVGVSRTFTGSN